MSCRGEEKNHCPNSRRTWSVYSDIGLFPSLFMCYRQQLPQVYSSAVTEETLLRVGLGLIWVFYDTSA